jgi:hypothetical protein
LTISVFWRAAFITASNAYQDQGAITGTSAARTSRGDHEPPMNNEAVKATLRGIKCAVGTASDRSAPALSFGGAFRRHCRGRPRRVEVWQPLNAVGWISTAARNGACVWKMKEISGHKSTDLLASDIREAELCRRHASVGMH